MEAAAATSGGPVTRRTRIAEDGVFGMALFVFVEVMFFSGFISAFVVVENSALPGAWPPLGQPRLPVATTAFNTLVLFVSGVFLALAQRAYSRDGQPAAARPLGIAVLLGTFFVGFQGFEWARLLAQGLTLTSSALGSFFYTIVGAHALHAVSALVWLGLQWRALRASRLSRSAFGAAQLFWYFVVLIWPVLYVLVYL
jgi:cytochrome c oxidase subunit 3